jgi:hypothetical protein
MPLVGEPISSIINQFLLIKPASKADSQNLQDLTIQIFDNFLFDHQEITARFCLRINFISENFLITLKVI